MFSRRARRVLCCICQTTCAETANALSYCTPVESPAPANLVESKYTDERCEHVSNIIQSSYPLTILWTDASDGKDFRAVDLDVIECSQYIVCMVS